MDSVAEFYEHWHHYSGFGFTSLGRKIFDLFVVTLFKDAPTVACKDALTDLLKLK